MLTVNFNFRASNEKPKGRLCDEIHSAYQKLTSFEFCKYLFHPHRHQPINVPTARAGH
jgi:hypothetical protein